MLEYIADVEECVQEMISLLGVEKKIEINLSFVDDVEKYINRVLNLKSSIIAIVAHSNQKETAEKVKKVLKRINPTSEIYEFYSMKINPKKIVILYN